MSEWWPAAETIIDQRFERRRALGAGATAVTFVAFDRAQRAEVALKILRSIDEHPRWNRELAVLGALSHPGLPSLIAHGAYGERGAYVAMRLQPGSSIRQQIISPISSERARRVGLAICEPLAYLHGRGIVHRDLKPEHILFAHDDTASIVDLGLASIGSRAALTARSIVGTLGYLPPEQLRPAPAEPDPRWDVFSLGCVLHACLLGAPPFDAQDTSAIVARTLAGSLDDLRASHAHVDPALRSLVARMLDPDPHRRPADASVVRDALASLPPLRSTAPPPRMLAVILGRPITTSAEDATPMLADATPAIDRGALPSDARVESLSDGSVVATLAAARADAPLARRAVQTALLLAEQLPSHAWSVALGEGTHRGVLPRGAAFDGAMSLLARARPQRLLVDAATALLVEDAFTVRSIESAFAVERATGRVRS